MTMAVSEAQKRANEKYIKANYEFIKVRLRKGQKDLIKAEADKAGKSLNEYILNRIFEQ